MRLKNLMFKDGFILNKLFSKLNRKIITLNKKILIIGKNN